MKHKCHFYDKSKIPARCPMHLNYQHVLPRPPFPPQGSPQLLQLDFCAVSVAVNTTWPDTERLHASS